MPSGGIVTTPATVLHGWLAVDGDGAFGRLELVNPHGRTVPLAAEDRPDVRAAMPDRASTGFTALLDIVTVGDGPWRLRYTLGNRTDEMPLALAAPAGEGDRFASLKARKLAAIRPLLRCPACRMPLVDDGDAIVCAHGHRYVVSAYGYDFLDDEVRQRVGAVATPNVSAHGYDPALRDVIASAKGPVLDAGAGLRPEYREDVVNLDIVGYPTTDVVAAGEFLPFADGSFDVVATIAVLEHVRDPFAVARELERVLRPGGTIFAAVPFLQPYHAYPDHYYNMTSAGLRRLFPGVDVDALYVPQSGVPVFALTWMLQSWRRALPPETAAAFESLTVRDLAADPFTLLDAPWVRELPASVNEELAALNVLIGRKRG